MIFGYQLTWVNIVYGGMVTALVLVFQMLQGLRIIKFKGRMQLKVHKASAWIFVALVVGHGLLALTLYNQWQIFS